jgi:hypothetical protein
LEEAGVAGDGDAGRDAAGQMRAVGGDPFARVRRGLVAEELDWYREDVGRAEEPGWLSVASAPLPARPRLLVEPGWLQSLDIDERWNPWEAPLENFRLTLAGDRAEARVPPREDMYPSHFLCLWSDGLLEFGYLLEPELRQPEHTRVLPRLPIVHYVHDYLALFGAVYARAAYAGPVAVSVALDHVSQYSLPGKRAGTAPSRLPDRFETTWTGAAGALGVEAGRIAKSALDPVWTAAGFERGCPFVDADGNLVAP